VIKVKEYENQILDRTGMEELLKIRPNTFKKNWRALPHFFVGQGSTLRGARFIKDDVMDYFRAQGGDTSRQGAENCCLKGNHYAGKQVSLGDNLDPFNLIGER
jgi:hypothetical protein